MGWTARSRVAADPLQHRSPCVGDDGTSEISGSLWNQEFRAVQGQGKKGASGSSVVVDKPHPANMVGGTELRCTVSRSDSFPQCSWRSLEPRWRRLHPSTGC